VTNDTYWKIRAYALLVELAESRLREATQAYHALLEQSGVSTERPLAFDDLRHTIHEAEHGAPHRNG